MTGVFIIAHWPLASALRDVAAHAFPELVARCAAYDVPAGSDTDRYMREAKAKLDALGCADVLVLTDVLGATPANLAIELARSCGGRALAGVNVPMLWRALNYAQLPLDDVMTRARDGGSMGIQTLVTPAPQNQLPKPLAHDSNQRHHQQ